MGRPRWTTVLVVCAVALMPIIVLWCMDLHLAAHFTSQPGKRSGGAMPKVAQTTRLASVLARRRTDDRSSDPSRPWPSTLHASNTTPSPLYKRHGAHALIASDTLQQGGQEARQRNFHSVHEVEVSSKDVSLPGGFKYVAASTGPSTLVVPRDRPRGGYFVEPPPVVSKVSDFRRASYIPYPKVHCTAQFVSMPSVPSDLTPNCRCRQSLCLSQLRLRTTRVWQCALSGVSVEFTPTRPRFQSLCTTLECTGITQGRWVAVRRCSTLYAGGA